MTLDVPENQRLETSIRIDDDSGSHTDETFHDDLLAWVQSTVHDTQAINDGADRHGPELDLLFRVNNVDKFLGLVGSECAVGE